MARAWVSLSLVVLCLAHAACGGSSNPAGPPVPTPTPTPTPAPQAMLIVGAQNNTFTVTSRTQVRNRTVVCGDAHVEWVFGETAGLGATLVQSDIYLLAANGDISEREVTPGGNRRIEALGTVTYQTNRMDCGTIGREYPFSMHSIWDWRDDHGNTIQIVDGVGLVER